MNTFHADRKAGDHVLVGGEIQGFITRVSFTYGNSEAIYSVEWFNNGAVQSADFYQSQLEDYPDGT